ncbi:MAG: TolC family protein [Hydrogenophilaceae bacterium]|nr:TolC family protein [Hydrogenophilaceae bacterium]
MPSIRATKAWLLSCAAFAAIAGGAHAEPLSFADAIERARLEGPSVAAQRASVTAAERSVRPAGALPDPQLVLGLQNVPADGPDAYRLDRDFMTMQSVGIMQDMPNGAERRARRAIAAAEVDRAGAALDIARLEAELGAAEAWIELYFAERRLTVIDRLGEEARALAVAARGRLAGGAGSVDGAIAAEIEAARIDDRRADLAAQATAARAQLQRWVGDTAIELEPAAPQFPIDEAQLRANLDAHPNLAAYGAEAAVADANLRFARAERAPDWSWSVMYQRRAPQFSDMASVEVRIGLPLFQSGRQGPLIEARRAEVQGVEAQRTAAERQVSAMLERLLAERRATLANLSRARDMRLPLARQRAEAASGAFAGGAASAEQLILARRDALEAELDVLQLEQRLAMLGAALTLQYGRSAP